MKKKILIIIIFLTLFFITNIIKVKMDYNKRVKDNEVVLFLGDSLTARYDLNTYFMSHYTINSGINGNITTDILKDMDNRVYQYNPKKIFLLIGINDLLFSNLSNEDINKNIKTIIKNIKKELPNTKIYLESLYPINGNVNKELIQIRNNKDINKLNTMLKNNCKKDCTYINVHNKLIDKKGNLNKIYTKDGIHLNKIGYFKVTVELLKYIDK